MNKVAKCLNVALFAMPLVLLSSCSSTVTSSVSQPESRQVVTSMPKELVLDINIIEGVTTKQEVIASIGKPQSIFVGDDETIFSYDTDSYRVTIKLNYIDDTGIEYNYSINRNLDNNDFEVFFDENSIVKGISI